MKKIKSFIIALMVFAVVGCSNNSSNVVETAPIETPSDTVVVTDQMGREVSFDKEPMKVVTTHYMTTTTVIALDAKDKLVGIEAKADKRKIFKLAAPELIELPNVGSLKEFNLEACLELKPDLVILNIKQKDYIEQLEGAGVKVLITNPESKDDLFGMIEMLGKVLNKNDRATSLINFMNDVSSEITDKIKDQEKVLTYFGGNSSFLSTAGPKMFQSSLLDAANATNVASNIEDTYWAEVSFEDIASYNPEAIILAADAAYDIDSVLNESSISAVNAITNQKVYKLPNDFESWDSPIPSSILAEVFIAKSLYPDLISDEYYKTTVKNFYSEFYGFEADVK
ncbi:MAG: ABC transporter substrate-binding protein [Anaerorhabdus sp.]